MKTNSKNNPDSPSSGTITLGLIYALIAAVISGISIFYNKLVIVKGVDPLIFNIIKNGGVAIVLTLFLLRYKGVKDLAKAATDRRLWLIGLVGGSIPFVLFFSGLTHVPAINANLIQKTLFIWVAILAIPLLKEKISPLAVIGYLLVIYANFFIGGLTEFKFSEFEVMILIATLFWAAENIIAKKTLANADSQIVAWGRMFFGLIILVGIAAFLGKLNLILTIRPDQLLPLTGSIGLLSLYVTFWYKALKLAPATVVTAILILATPVTNILSAVFLTRNFESVANPNSLILFCGVLIISLGLKWQNKIAA